MGTIFIPKETVAGETRVAATPETVKKYVDLGFTVQVESGAGVASSIADAAYEKAGAKVAPATKESYQADIVAKLHPPGERDLGHEADLLKPGGLFIGFVWALTNLDLVKRLNQNKVSVFAMEMVPRITRAQKMDALSSQSNIAGYKAVLLAADHAVKLFPMLMTAAGTIRPSRVVILGAGVAGLQAIATAKRLGAIVEVSDVRPAVKEQVQSLGGNFIEVPGSEDMEDEGGYAKEATPEFLAKQKELVGEHIKNADAVITTALVPGKPAPKLISKELVSQMKHGAVIVDLAAEQGGNCELTRSGEIAEENGVKILGLLNLPAMLPVHATEMYAKNILNVLGDIVKDGAAVLDFEDEVVAGSVVTHGGEVRHPRVQEALK